VSSDRLEVVLVEVLGDLLTKRGTLRIGGAKVDASQTRASMISLSASRSGRRSAWSRFAAEGTEGDLFFLSTQNQENLF
jgi:hypothetical protein